MPRIESRLRYVEHVRGRGVALFDRVWRRDCESIGEVGLEVGITPMRATP
jgi:hypothetical protein